MNRRPRDRVRVRELALALADARDRGRDSDRANARACVNACVNAYACARYLALHSTTPRTLVDLAVRLLPVAQRPRYCEEFRGELAEMVELSHQERWGYALRVLAGAWQLRRALVEAPPGTPGGAPARRAEG